MQWKSKQKSVLTTSDSPLYHYDNNSQPNVRRTICGSQQKSPHRTGLRQAGIVDNAAYSV